MQLESHDLNSLRKLVRDLQDKFDVVVPEELYGKLTCINDFVLEIANLKKINVKGDESKKTNK